MLYYNVEDGDTMSLFELEKTEELFENDDIIILKSLFAYDDLSMRKTDIAVKDENGEIIDFITVKKEILS